MHFTGTQQQMRKVKSMNIRTHPHVVMPETPEITEMSPPDDAVTAPVTPPSHVAAEPLEPLTSRLRTSSRGPFANVAAEEVVVSFSVIVNVPD